MVLFRYYHCYCFCCIFCYVSPTPPSPPHTSHTYIFIHIHIHIYIIYCTRPPVFVVDFSLYSPPLIYIKANYPTNRIHLRHCTSVAIYLYIHAHICIYAPHTHTTPHYSLTLYIYIYPTYIYSLTHLHPLTRAYCVLTIVIVLHSAVRIHAIHSSLSHHTHTLCHMLYTHTPYVCSILCNVCLCVPVLYHIIIMHDIVMYTIYMYVCVHMVVVLVYVPLYVCTSMFMRTSSSGSAA